MVSKALMGRQDEIYDKINELGKKLNLKITISIYLLDERMNQGLILVG